MVNRAVLAHRLFTGVDACTEASPALLAASLTPHAALGRSVDFLVTNYGLAAALQTDSAGFSA